ncbi:MAG: glutamine amidotransferase [Candidatus Latescibacteria bacterium]|nr:glutamine amidotransferase [Candidatus Latescibacterota bacterium]
MSLSNLDLRIAVLYADRMSIYGDYGNLLALTNRCHWRGIDAQTALISVGDPLEPGQYDLFLFGGGQDRQQVLVADDLHRGRGKALIESAEAGAVILAICGGYQLLGHYYQPADGPRIPGIGLLDVWTVAGNRRMIGNVIIECDWLEPDTLVGFENHSGKTYLGKTGEPMGRRVVGCGNNGEDTFEGCRYKNVFGCYLHGPIMPRNPHFADLLIRLALRHRYGDVPLAPLDDALEWEAHRAALARAGIKKEAAA